MVLVGNPTMGTSKAADITDSKAIGKTTEADTVEVIGTIEGAFIVAEIADYMPKQWQ